MNYLLKFIPVSLPAAGRLQLTDNQPFSHPNLALAPFPHYAAKADSFNNS